MPIPPIYVRTVQGADKKAVGLDKRRIVRQVVDGQQRVSAVLDYIDGTYRLSKTLKASWAGKNFSALSGDEQQRILAYGFPTEVFHGISDLEVLEMFARLNTYSVPLNDQELRNGKFFGLFKQACYRLAHEHLEFWRRHRIFSERSIARMLEVELVSELVIAGLAGMQDKKKSIDGFYEKYDEEFSKLTATKRRLRSVLDQINETFPKSLAETEFSRSPLTYTLYCVVYHRNYGLPGAKQHSPHKALDTIGREQLAEAVVRLSEIVAADRADEDVPSRFTRFAQACRRQTDNIKPREIRFATLYSLAF